MAHANDNPSPDTTLQNTPAVLCHQAIAAAQAKYDDAERIAWDHFLQDREAAIKAFGMGRFLPLFNKPFPSRRDQR